jgi:hypothetical protein
VHTAGLIRANLENDPAIVYFLDCNLRIIHCNLAWNRFALKNGGKHLLREMVLGHAVMDSVPAPLKAFYASAYTRVLNVHQSWECTYECSSAAAYRVFRMGVYPDPHDSGLVVVNSLTVERPHGSECPPSSLIAGYTSEHGIINMCCHCRRTQRTGHAEIWDWVPSIVESIPPFVSHGICPVCANLFYS